MGTKLNKNGEILPDEIFAFKQRGLTESGEVDGEFILYDEVPKIYQKIKARGIMDIDDIFYPNVEEKKEAEPKKEMLYYEGKYKSLVARK